MTVIIVLGAFALGASLGALGMALVAGGTRKDLERRSFGGTDD